MTSKVGDTLKPDAAKSNTEVAGDKLSGAADRVAAAVTPGQSLPFQTPSRVGRDAK